MSEPQMKVTDLRSALAVLSQYDDELIYTDEPVDPIPSSPACTAMSAPTAPFSARPALARR